MKQLGRLSEPPDDYLIRPNPSDPRLTERVSGIDQTGAPLTTSVTVERALTIYLNRQEIVTAMTIGDYPDYLVIGYKSSSAPYACHEGRGAAGDGGSERAFGQAAEQPHH